MNVLPSHESFNRSEGSSILISAELAIQNSISSELLHGDHSLYESTELAAAMELLMGGQFDLLVSTRDAVSQLCAKAHEALQRISLRTPVVLLLTNNDQNLLDPGFDIPGLQSCLRWPEERDALSVLTQSLLRARQSSPAHSENRGGNWIDALRETGDQRQRLEVITALRTTHGNIQRAADLLGLSRGGLHYRIRKFNLVQRDYR